MTRDNIIRMARDAGLLPLLDEDCFQTMGTKNFGATKKVLERFAALAAAAGAEAEREACISIIESHRIPVGNSAAGEMACEWTYDALHEIRDAIRARGEK